MQTLLCFLFAVFTSSIISLPVLKDDNSLKQNSLNVNDTLRQRSNDAEAEEANTNANTETASVNSSFDDFDNFDEDDNGFIDFKEMHTLPHYKQLIDFFDKVDYNGDKKLDRSEFKKLPIPGYGAALDSGITQLSSDRALLSNVTEPFQLEKSHNKNGCDNKKECFDIFGEESEKEMDANYEFVINEPTKEEDYAGGNVEFDDTLLSSEPEDIDVANDFYVNDKDASLY